VDHPNPIPRLLKHPLRVSAVLQLTLRWIKAYFSAQEEVDVDDCTIVETAVDERIAPDAEGIYPYLFASIYAMYAGWIVLDRLPTRRYRRARSAFLDLITESRQIFVTHPTCMRDRERSDHPLLRYTQRVDGPTNCFPSLHVAITTLAYQIVRDQEELDPLLAAALRRACVDVCRSTLRTKQHAVVDVIGGFEIARRIFERNMEGRYEDLMPTVLPELSDDELHAARVCCENAEDVGALLRPLLEAFSRVPGASK